jgi:hypothetical protein
VFRLRGVDVDLRPRRPRSVPNVTAEGLTRFPRSRAKAAVLVIVQVGKRIGTDTKRTPPRATGVTSGPHG